VRGTYHTILLLMPSNAADKILNQLPLVILSILIIFIVPGIAASAAQNITSSCPECHFETYEKAISNPYGHEVVKDDCAACHIIKVDHADNDRTRNKIFSITSTENLLYLGESVESNRYRIKIVARDDDKGNSEPVFIDINPAELESRNYPAINEISGVKVDEIKKGPFCQASISWFTDTPATSEIEYVSEEGHKNRFSIDDIYTRNHQLILPRLKHNSTYSFEAVSIDLSGNEMRSQTFTLTTTEEFSHKLRPPDSPSSFSKTDNLHVYKINDSEGLYMRAYTDRPAQLILSIKESDQERKDKHGNGLTTMQFLTIDVCTQCHDQNASHPVGIRPKNERVKIPPDLPTIQNNMLTCVTCHFAHGGKHIYFARFDLDKKICIKCHVDGYNK
jgi:hypothetical protein